jgi:abelson tyrosine-protein kinase 1
VQKGALTKEIAVDVDVEISAHGIKNSPNIGGSEKEFRSHALCTSLKRTASLTCSPPAMSSPNTHAHLTESPSSSNNNTPSQNVSPLPGTTPPTFLFPFRSRGQSTSAMRSPSPSSVPLSPLSRVTSAPAGGPSDDDSASWFLSSHHLLHSPPARSKKLSDPGIDARTLPRRGIDASPPAAPSTWWNRTDIASRGWKDSPRRKDTIPAEHTEAWLQTRDVSVSHIFGNLWTV